MKQGVAQAADSIHLLRLVQLLLVTSVHLGTVSPEICAVDAACCIAVGSVNP